MRVGENSRLFHGVHDYRYFPHSQPNCALKECVKKDGIKVYLVSTKAVNAETALYADFGSWYWNTKPESMALKWGESRKVLFFTAKSGLKNKTIKCKDLNFLQIDRESLLNISKMYLRDLMKHDRKDNTWNLTHENYTRAFTTASGK